MKNYLLVMIALIITGSLAFGTEKKEKSAADSIKTGWNFGGLPAISFDTDLGFQYGALVNFFNYGDGTRFPVYNHSLYFEVSRYTKGSGIYRFYYDSDRLIKNINVNFDLTFMPDQAHDFYGFNGYDAVFNKNWEDDQSSAYKTRMFYKLQQNLFRFKVDLQGKIGNTHLKWLAGFNMLNFNLSSVDIDKLNKNKNEADKLPANVPGLYEKYKAWNVFTKEEADGGFIPELKAGIVFDNRDNKPNPMKGIWTEAEFITAPKFLGAETGFTKFAITHRQYFTIVKNDLSFAYRLGWQQTIAGNVPFYYQTQIATSVMRNVTSDGLGGARTLRGARRYRVVGDGIVYGNLELRWKFARANLINQKFYFGLNGFMDFGQVTKKIDIAKNLYSQTEYFKSGAEKMHSTYGLGLRISMNQNFIIAIDHGRVLNKEDGDAGTYIGLNYLF